MEGKSMQEQGNADVIAVPVNGEAGDKSRPDWVAAAKSAVNAVRSGDLDAVRTAQRKAPENPYYVAEIADALGVSKSTIYKAVESGTLGAMRIGQTRKGTIRVSHGAFVEYLAACTAAAVTRPGANVKRRSIRVEVRSEVPTEVVA